MKRIALLLALTLATNLTFAQEKWFVRFTDSISLVNNANKIATIFVDDIKKIKPDIKFDIKAIMNTTPSLIFYNENTKTVNLPLWEQLKPEQKNFFYEVAGNEESGKTAFGLFLMVFTCRTNWDTPFNIRFKAVYHNPMIANILPTPLPYFGGENE